MDKKPFSFDNEAEESVKKGTMRIRKFFKKHLKDVKAIPGPERYAFNEKTLSTNLFRERVSACFVALYVFINIILDVAYYSTLWDTTPAYRNLLIIHVVSIIIYLGLFVFHFINVKKRLKCDKAIHFLYIFVGLFINEAISINAQLMHGQIATYIIALVSISILLLLNNTEIILVLSLSFFTFIAGIIIVQPDTLKVISIINNSLATIICSFLFSRLTFSAYIQEFIVNNELAASLKKVTEQTEIIERQRVKLHNIVESTDDFIWSVDREYKIITCNAAIRNYLKDNYGVDWVTGESAEIFPSDYTSVWSDLYEFVVNEGKYNIDLKSGDRTFAYTLNGVYVNSELTEITIFGKDITSRIDKEREIIKQNLMLERSVIERTKELHNSINELQHISLVVAHKLKVPLMEIENDLKNSELDTLTLERMLQRCKDTSTIIEKFYYYVISTNQQIHKEKIDMRKLIISIFSEFKKNYENSTLQFVSGLPKVTADKALIQQVISNIISNALKCSAMRQCAEITVGCWENNEEYIFYIKDNGVGFDMAFSSKTSGVFDHRKEEFKETGIGLAAIRNIVKRHGGRTWLESEIERGTTVYFALPI